MKSIVTILFLITSIKMFSQTNISGGIFSSTTWDAAGSPYIISGTVVVFQDLLLTIKPGAEVRFKNGACLEMRGKLNVLGRADSLVIFTADTTFPYKGCWKGIDFKITSDPVGQGNQANINYLKGEYADRLFDLDFTHNGPYIFDNSIFSNNNYVNYDGAVGGLSYTNCTFNSNNHCVSGGNITPTVNNCIFNNNVKGVEGYSDVRNSLFNNNHIALDYATKVYNNEFYQNDTAIYAWFYSGVQMVNNHIHDNNVGIYIYTFGIDPGIYFRYNKVCNNMVKNVIYEYSGNADLSQNCWCSEDSITIHSTIADGYYNIAYGLTRVFPTYNSNNCLTIGFEENTPPSILMYPNPVDDYLNINTNNTSGEIFLYDMNGRLIKSQLYYAPDVKIMDLREFTPGMYFIIFQTNFGCSVQKLSIK